MSDKSLLFYESVPSWYRFHKQVTVVRFQMTRMQSYVLGEFGDCPSIDQVLQRGQYVKKLMERVEEELIHRVGESNYLLVMKSEGELTAAIRKNVMTQQIVELAQNIQKIIYKVSGGRMELAYAISSATASVWNDKTESQDNVLDELEAEIQKSRYHCTSLIKMDFHNVGTESWATMPLMSASRLGRPSSSEGGKRKPLVMIRFDLDNMYTFLRRIKTCDTYKLVQEKVCDGLTKAVEANSSCEVVFVGKDEICVIAVAEQAYEILNQAVQKLDAYFKGISELSSYTYGVTAAVAPLDYQEEDHIYCLEAFCWAEHLIGVAKKVSGKNSVAFPSEFKSVVISWQQCDIMGKILKANRYKLCNGAVDQIGQIVIDPIALKDELLHFATGLDRASIAKVGV